MEALELLIPEPEGLPASNMSPPGQLWIRCWCYAAGHDLTDDTHVAQFIAAIYWATTTVTTIGYGEELLLELAAEVFISANLDSQGRNTHPGKGRCQV